MLKIHFRKILYRDGKYKLVEMRGVLTMYVTLQPLFWEKLSSMYMAVVYPFFLEKQNCPKVLRGTAQFKWAFKLQSVIVASKNPFIYMFITTLEKNINQ